MANAWTGLAVTLIVASAIGCSAGPEPSVEVPSPPADWVTVTSQSGDLWLVLPPWLVPFDRTGAVFANEVVPGGGQGVQLVAEGPATAEPQPGREGAQRWLEQRVETPGAGPAAITAGRLPSGEAVFLQRIDRDGTPLAWTLNAWAITTPFGTAYLLLDGPPDAWAAHQADIAQIPLYLRAGPGTRAAPGVGDVTPP